MPNWVKNKIIVGKTEYGKRIVDKYTTIEDGKTKFDFNKVIEMPKDLQIEFSSKSDNAFNFKTSDNNRMLMFETAWDPAIPVFLEMSRQNPDIKFAFLYADESIGSHVGYVLAKAGHIDFEGTFEDYSVDAYKLSFDLWECEDDYEYSNELGTYVYKEDSEESEESFIN